MNFFSAIKDRINNATDTFLNFVNNSIFNDNIISIIAAIRRVFDFNIILFCIITEIQKRGFAMLNVNNENKINLFVFEKESKDFLLFMYRSYPNFMNVVKETPKLNLTKLVSQVLGEVEPEDDEEKEVDIDSVGGMAVSVLPAFLRMYSHKIKDFQYFLAFKMFENGIPVIVREEKTNKMVIKIMPYPQDKELFLGKYFAFFEENKNAAQEVDLVAILRSLNNSK